MRSAWQALLSERLERKHLAGDLHAEFGEKTHDELEALQVHVAVAGA